MRHGERVVEVVTGGQVDITHKCVELGPGGESSAPFLWAICMEKVGEDVVPVKRFGRFVVIASEPAETAEGVR